MAGAPGRLAVGTGGGAGAAGAASRVKSSLSRCSSSTCYLVLAVLPAVSVQRSATYWVSRLRRGRRRRRRWGWRRRRGRPRLVIGLDGLWPERCWRWRRRCRSPVVIVLFLFVVRIGRTRGDSPVCSWRRGAGRSRWRRGWRRSRGGGRLLVVFLLRLFVAFVSAQGRGGSCHSTNGHATDSSGSGGHTANGCASNSS